MSTESILHGLYIDGRWSAGDQSSIGRELGPWGLAAFQEIKHVIRAVQATTSAIAPDPAAVARQTVGCTRG